MSKSAIYVANTGSQSVGVDGIIGLGTVVRRFGCETQLLGNSITVDETGYYDVNVSVTLAPNTAGTATVTLLNNGVAVTGATASETVATVGDLANLSFESIVRVFCGADTGALTLVLSDTASTVSNVAVVVKKI